MSDQPDITGQPVRQAGFAAEASDQAPGHVYFQVCIPREVVLENAGKPDALLPFTFHMNADAATSIAMELLSAGVVARRRVSQVSPIRLETGIMDYLNGKTPADFLLDPATWPIEGSDPRD